MLHWLIVGHIDPRDPIDRGERPYRPKVSRSIPKDAAERVLDEFGRDIDPYLSYGETGYVVCGWSQAPYKFWDRVQEFAHFLAKREGAVVMDERFMVSWPDWARQAQQAAWGTDAGKRRVSGAVYRGKLVPDPLELAPLELARPWSGSRSQR